LESKFNKDHDFFRFYIVKFTERSFFEFQSKVAALAEEILKKSLDYDILSSDSKRIGVLLAYRPVDISATQFTSRV
jgi:hypothetical protein